MNALGEVEDADRARTDDARDNFFMYYSTMLKGTKEKAIAYATSSNGFAFDKRGVALLPDAGTLDGMGCARCNVVRKSRLNDDGLWDDTAGGGASSEGWIMFYEGVSSADGRHRILAAESDDLRNWTKVGLALDVGRDEDGAWDAGGVGSPHVIRLDDGFYRMYYTGEGMDGRTAIGVAKSVDLANWEREQAEVTFAFE